MTRSTPVQFPGNDALQLAGIFDQPSEHDGNGSDIRAYAIFAHCFSCHKNVLAASRICKRLAHNGFGVLRFDFTGLGDSQGNFSDTGFSTNVGDILAAADWLGTHHAAPKLVIGHSLGGAAAIVAAHQLPSVKAVSTIGSPAHADHVLEHMEDFEHEIMEDGEALVPLPSGNMIIKRQFVEDLRAQDVLKAVRSLKRAYINFHSPVDDTVGLENARELYKTARHPKSFVSLDDMDHLVSQREDGYYIADILAAWVRRYL